MSNQLKTILLLGALSALLIAIGGAMGPDFLTYALVGAAVMNLGAVRNVAPLFSTHPSTEERVRRLRAMEATEGRSMSGWSSRVPGTL